jgi:hypothetical protein
LPERPKPILPFCTDDDEEDDEDEDEGEEALVVREFRAAPRLRNPRSKNFTRNIQRKKDKEMAELQFAGGDGSASETKASHFSQEGGPQRSLPLRQRQEVQEMPRSLVLAVVFASSACAAIWPDTLGEYQRQSAAPLSLSRGRLGIWLRGRRARRLRFFRVTASRFKDTTGAYAAAWTPRPVSGWATTW